MTEFLLGVDSFGDFPYSRVCTPCGLLVVDSSTYKLLLQ